MKLCKMEDYSSPILRTKTLVASYSWTGVSRVATGVVVSCSSSVSGNAGKRDVRMLPAIQPIAPSPTVKPNHVSNTVLYGTEKTEASTPARIIPNVRPVVTPIRQPGWARLRPRNRFIIVCVMYPFIFWLYDR